MPPQRTIPPAKAVKTERTHEENQERAYIAASRRSDRSLEARVESARRASEIHKRRTGRSLRVTEQDVVNEEMYEEEDDDLPLQYRRLTQHLQTGSADFNKRLSAYLTQHVAMRSALEQGIAQSYAQQYPNAPQFQGQYSMYQSPMLAHQQQQQQMFNQPFSPTTSSPSMQQTTAGFRPQHQRSASIATTQELAGKPQISSPFVESNDRRASVPASNSTSTITSPNTTKQSASPFAKAISPNSLQRPSIPSFPQGSFSNSSSFSSLPQYQNGAFGSTDFLGFSTGLAPESQGFLKGGLDANDPLTSMFMHGSQYDFASNNNTKSAQQQSNDSLNKMGTSGTGQMYPSFDGLNSTLAQAQGGINPSALDGSNTGSVFEQQSFFDAGLGESHGGTGENTPGGGEEWSLFMNDDKWDVPASQ